MSSRSLSPSPQPADASLRALGEALRARHEEVLARILERTRATGTDVDPPARAAFERVCEGATTAVAEWMAGGDPKAGLGAGQQAWEVFGALAAHREAPLHEVTKRCLRWRDAVQDVLRDAAGELDVPAEVLSWAQAMAQKTLDVTFVKMCEAFETERARTDDELFRREEELVFLATHDQLTGLPNRTLILDRVEQMFGRARRRGTPVAALCVNLDNFTAINDTLGRSAGDQLLQAVAARLQGAVRETDALGRLGADEFVVLAEDLVPGAGADIIAERLQAALTAPFTAAGHESSGVRVTASIGIATGGRAGAEELLRDAEIAMHRAKWEGKGSHVVFESGMQDLVQSRMELEMDLRAALGREEFHLLYQPTFDLRTMQPTGVEALIRWHHRERGVVQPNDFIPLLEETGLIVPVGRWVLEEACRQGASWRRAGHGIGMAVNVSGRQLDNDEFIADVQNALVRSGFEPAGLTLEITETTLMRNPEETSRRLRAIRELGVRIAIDDFGTGYSSLAHLQRFPVDALKIDRSFISQLADNPEGETLIRTLVQLGKALSIETLAEGIEHERELVLLLEEHCDSGQGYLFARPLEPEAAAAFLRDWRGVPSPAAAIAGATAV